jgi:hypothetical protein
VLSRRYVVSGSINLLPRSTRFLAVHMILEVSG